jgi:ABC-type Zn uptake system ZnuABC Zn-binding protein ZnuA
MSACSDPTPPMAPAGPPVVVTFSHPADALVRALAPPNAITQRLMLGEGADPATWQPTGDQVAELAHADLLVANGAGYEAWLATASLPADRLVLTSGGLDLIELTESTHQHGDGGEHRHARHATQTWMDPTRYAAQAAVAHAALGRLLPNHRADLDRRYDSFTAKLDGLDHQLMQSAACARDARLATNGSSFVYLADRTGLDLTVLALDPGQQPTPGQVEAAQRWAGGGHRAAVLWDVAPADRVREALPGMAHLVMDPLEQPEDGVYDPILQAETNLDVFGRFCLEPSRDR